MTEKNSNPPFFEARALSFGYDRGPDVLRDLAFSISAGQIVGLIGPNGAGKSTLLHLMTGLLRPRAGEILIQGQVAGAMDPGERARRVGFVPQSTRVLFPYSVAEIVAMGRHPHGRPLGGLTAEDREAIAWAMQATGVEPFARRLISELSGGEAQRVFIARALAQRSPALVLDEPTSSLDLFYQTAVYGLLERMNRERALTVVVVTHDINLAAEYCERLIGIREGRILMDGPPEQILTTNSIYELYGVQAEILVGEASRAVRVRHEPSAAPSATAGNS